MDDLLDAARKGVTGTAADFSNWNGVKEGNFKHMKINSSEKIIEPEQETDAELVQSEINKEGTTVEVPKQQLEKEETKKDINDVPGVQQAYLNPIELKNIAVKLMPTVDTIMSNIHEELDINTMRNISETAINLAFTFLQVWNEKVTVEKQ